MRLCGLHRQGVQCLDLAGDVALSAAGRTAVVWCLRTGKALCVLENGHELPIKHCKLFLEGEAEQLRAMTCSEFDEEVLIWDAITGQVLPQAVSKLAKNTEIEEEECVSFDETSDEVKIFPPGCSASPLIVLTNQSHLTCARYLPEKRLLCTSDRDGTVRRSFVKQAMPPGSYWFDAHAYVFDSHSAQVNTLCLSQDGTYCLSGSEDTTLYYFDLFPHERRALVLLCYKFRLAHHQPFLRVRLAAMVKDMLL